MKLDLAGLGTSDQMTALSPKRTHPGAAFAGAASERRAESSLSLHSASRSAIRRRHMTKRRARWVLFEGMRGFGLSHSFSDGAYRRMIMPMQSGAVVTYRLIGPFLYRIVADGIHIGTPLAGLVDKTVPLADHFQGAITKPLLNGRCKY